MYDIYIQTITFSNTIFSIKMNLTYCILLMANRKINHFSSLKFPIVFKGAGSKLFVRSKSLNI